MNKECQTGIELDCPLYSICQYNHKERIIANIDPLKSEGSWEYQGRNYSCQKREINIVSLLK
jgi:hypothetical protein